MRGLGKGKSSNSNRNVNRKPDMRKNTSRMQNGGLRDKRMLDTSLRNIENNPTHILFKDVPMPPNPDAKTNPPKKSEKK